jgi:hypothetical protein
MCLAPMVARWQRWIEQSLARCRSKAAKATLLLASPDGAADPPRQHRPDAICWRTDWKVRVPVERVLGDLLFSIL